MYYPFGYGIVWHVIGWLLVIWLIVWIIRMIARGHHLRNRRPWMNADNSVALLRERYAKGEITKEQFETMKKDLQ